MSYSFTTMQEDLADDVCRCLVERAEMLDDYFSVEISEEEVNDDGQSGDKGPFLK